MSARRRGRVSHSGVQRPRVGDQLGHPDLQPIAELGAAAARRPPAARAPRWPSAPHRPAPSAAAPPRPARPPPPPCCGVSGRRSGRRRPRPGGPARCRTRRSRRTPRPSGPAAPDRRPPGRPRRWPAAGPRRSSVNSRRLHRARQLPDPAGPGRGRQRRLLGEFEGHLLVRVAGAHRRQHRGPPGPGQHHRHPALRHRAQLADLRPPPAGRRAAAGTGPVPVHREAALGVVADRAGTGRGQRGQQRRSVGGRHVHRQLVQRRGADRPATAGSPVSPSRSASASDTPSTATSALVCAAKCATPARIIRCTMAPFGSSAADRVHPGQQQRMVGRAAGRRRRRSPRPPWPARSRRPAAPGPPRRPDHRRSARSRPRIRPSPAGTNRPALRSARQVSAQQAVTAKTRSGPAGGMTACRSAPPDSAGRPADRESGDAVLRRGIRPGTAGGLAVLHHRRDHHARRRRSATCRSWPGCSS